MSYASECVKVYLWCVTSQVQTKLLIQKSTDLNMESVIEISESALTALLLFALFIFFFL